MTSLLLMDVNWSHQQLCVANSAAPDGHSLHPLSTLCSHARTVYSHAGVLNLHAPFFYSHASVVYSHAGAL